VQSSDSEDEITDTDDDGDGQGEGEEPKVLDAHGLAMGTLMLKKKSKQALIDDAYNRHAFEDDILPEWFVDHEKKFRTGPIKEVPKDMLEFYRQRMKELNARPIKKIAEAKARKKMKEMRKIETMKKKMESVMSNGDMGEGAKAKEIEKLMRRKNKKSERREVKYVVAKKGRNRGRPAGVKGPYKMVDGRMKKDARAMKRAEQRKGSKKSKKR
jgi:AdoMet-dependent rRNA methyltransferase SPB1